MGKTQVTNGCYSADYSSGIVPTLTLWDPATPSSCPNTIIASSHGGRRLLSKMGRRLLQTASTSGGPSGLDTGGALAMISTFLAGRNIVIGSSIGPLHIED